MTPYLKTLSSGKVRVYIKYKFNGKSQNLPKKYYPDFSTNKQAQNWIQKLRNTNKYDELISKHQGFATFTASRKSHQFTELFKLYKRYQTQKAPNSYKNNLNYLEHHVFRFFLNIIKIYDLNLWYLHHGEFIDWLQDEARIKNNKRKLSQSSRNHCIKALNSFYKYMIHYSKIDPRNALKLNYFRGSEFKRGVNDLVDKKEAKNLLNKLGCSRDFYLVGRHTGMRFSEILGLSIADIKKVSMSKDNQFLDKDNKVISHPIEPWIVDIIRKKLAKKIYGYIYFCIKASGF